MYLKGLSYVEMAAALGVTKNAVAGRIGRLREAERKKREAAGVPKPRLPKKPRKSYTLRFKKISPANHAHPLFRRIIVLMNEHQISRRALCKRVGISEQTFDNYRTRDTPKLTVIEAMYNVFGKTLAETDIED